MAGHVRERSPGRWELRIYVGTDPETGRRRVRTKTVSATSKRAAQRLADAWALEVGDAGLDAGRATFGEVVEEWVATKAKSWTPGTLSQHRSIVNAHLGPLLDLKVHQIRTVDLDRFYRRLVDEKGLKVSTVQRIHVVVRAALEQAVRWELIARNPARIADPGQVVETEVTPPTLEQLAEILAAAEAEAPEWAAFLVLAAVTGARRGAMCALRWSDVNLDVGVVGFRRVISEGAGVVAELPASSKKRTTKVAALDPVTVEVLTELRSAMEGRARAFGVDLQADAFVFTDDPEGGRPWRPNYVTKRFIRLRRELGLPETVHLHDLRHFMATIGLTEGVDVKAVAQRGGWAKASTLLDRYAHVLEATDQHLAGVLGAAVHRGRATASTGAPRRSGEPTRSPRRAARHPKRGTGPAPRSGR